MCHNHGEDDDNCVTCHDERVKRVSEHLGMLNAEVGDAVSERDALLDRIEYLKQQKRDIRAAARGKGLSAADRYLLDTLTREISSTEVLRKNKDQDIRQLKWTAAQYAIRWVQVSEARDGVLGQPLIHPFAADEFGTAVFVGEYELDSYAWHQARLRGVGGSEVSIILGTSPFGKVERLFEVKTRQRSAGNGKTSAMALGDAYEGYIQRQFALTHPEYRVFHTKGSWRSKAIPYQLANVDGLYASDGGEIPDGVLEIKNVSHPEQWEDAPPLHYRQQVLWYMDTFGLKEGRVVALIHGQEYKEFLIVAEPGEIEAMRAGVARFAARVSAYFS